MKLDHIGIATSEITEALELWQDRLGLSLDHTEEVTEQGVRVRMLALGDTHVELLEPLHGDTPVGRFLKKRGAGLHHIAVAVEDIRRELSKLRASGARLIDEEPRVGAAGCLVAFVHPTSTGGVLLELVQRP